MPGTPHLVQAITHSATPLVGAPADFDLLLDRIGDARFVLLGEATHGTHEFYRIRAELTKRLIVEKGFSAIAVEADWPDAFRVNRYVRGTSRDGNATQALSDFRRFPQWMWRNADVVDLVGWLRSHNDAIAQPERRVGFYGLDVYSLHASMDAVLAYLDRNDPEAARRARDRYACFEPFGEEPQAYGHAAAFRLDTTCEDAVVAQLVELQRRRGERPAARDLDAEEQFAAEQNARVVVGAEEYFRTLYAGYVSTWNLRDTHMMDTLDALAAHLDRLGDRSKIIVWAHNSHVGDAAATTRDQYGEINIGHLCRKRHSKDTILVGFTTYDGTVTAARDWGGNAERREVRPALRDSYEAIFHATGVPSFLLMLDDLGEAAGALHEPRLQRAIGVVYRPQTERASHYYEVQLPAQFNAVIHVDRTRAVEPLERSAAWDRGDLPDTFPSGL